MIEVFNKYFKFYYFKKPSANMENNKKITISLVSPVTLILFILFFISKVYGGIDWSWWWVFSPLWIPLAFILFIIFIIIIIWQMCIIIESINGIIFSRKCRK